MFPPPPSDRYALLFCSADLKEYEYRTTTTVRSWAAGRRDAVQEWQARLLCEYPPAAYGTRMSVEVEDVEAGLLAVHACRGQSCD